MDRETTWICIGFVGQACFTSRFIVQWLVSERHGKSIIPHAFWYFSLLGGSTLLLYALHRQDPVFILGQSTGLFIYFRNLYLIRREERDKQNKMNKPKIPCPRMA